MPQQEVSASQAAPSLLFDTRGGEPSPQLQPRELVVYRTQEPRLLMRGHLSVGVFVVDLPSPAMPSHQHQAHASLPSLAVGGAHGSLQVSRHLCSLCRLPAPPFDDNCNQRQQPPKSSRNRSGSRKPHQQLMHCRIGRLVLSCGSRLFATGMVFWHRLCGVAESS